MIRTADPLLVPTDLTQSSSGIARRGCRPGARLPLHFPTGFMETET